MSNNDNKNLVTAGIHYIPNELLSKHDGDRLVASTLLKNIFLPSSRVPKQIIDKIASDPDMLEKQLTAQVPLQQVYVSEPYWTKGANIREYDRVEISIFGAISLADDRHCLDCIIAWGSLINNASNLTLREITEQYMGMAPNWDAFPDQSVIDNKLSNQGVYFHVNVNVLLEAMNLTKNKFNRNRILDRLQRLSIMTLKIRFEKDRQLLPNRSKNISLVDRNFFPILDMNKIRNRSCVANDTFTDLVICVSGFYLSSLSSEGGINRKRFKTAYLDLVGSNSVVDLFKELDFNQREYLHGKWLSDVVFNYLKSKAFLYGVNKHLKCNELIKELVRMRNKLQEHYNFILEEEDNPRKRIRSQDYRIYYLPKLQEAKF